MRAENEPKPSQSQGELKEVNLLDPIISIGKNTPFNWDTVIVNINGVEYTRIKGISYEDKKS